MMQHPLYLSTLQTQFDLIRVTLQWQIPNQLQSTQINTRCSLTYLYISDKGKSPCHLPVIHVNTGKRYEN